MGGKAAQGSGSPVPMGGLWVFERVCISDTSSGQIMLILNPVFRGLSTIRTVTRVNGNDDLA